MAAIAAGPILRLLGAKDAGMSCNYIQEEIPPVNVGLPDGHLAWQQRNGGHTDGPNWKYVVAWADKFFRRTPPV